MRRRAIIAMTLLAGIGAMIPRIARGQESRGTIVGTVTDASGGAIPEATVQVTNIGTNVSTEVTTNMSGNFRVPYLLSGQYTVKVKMVGFKDYVRTGLELRIADTLELKIPLEVGSPSDQVLVTAESPLLETADGSRGAVINRSQLQELPIKDGAAAELIVLAPGMANTTTLRPRKAAFSQGLSLVSANGVGEARNDFTVDGIPNNTVGTPGGGAEDASSYTQVAIALPNESIEEVKVQTNVYDATQGHTPGAVFNMVTRGGTNEFHGEAHEYLKNTVLNANDFFSNLSGSKRPDLRDNRYGFSIGGPVLLPNLYSGRNKTFFFYSFENNPFTTPVPQNFTVPTPEMLQGDFSALLALGSRYQIYDPLSIKENPDDGHFYRTPFPNNIIPASRLDPAAKRIAQFWPKPNRAPSTADFRGNYFFNNAGTGDWYRTHTARVDHAFSPKHRIFGRVSLDKWRSLKNNYFFNEATGLEGFRETRLVGLDDVYVFSSNVVLNVKAGLMRQPFSRRPQSMGIDYSGLGFSPSLVGLVPKDVAAFPTISVGSYLGFGGNPYFINNNTTESLGGTLSWQKGKHNVRFGVEWRSTYQHLRDAARDIAPRLVFNKDWTSGPTEVSSSQPIGGELAAFLMGVPSDGNMTLTNGFTAHNNWYGFFVHDDWKVARRLTMNIGLRYELDMPLTERDDRMVNGFDLTTPLAIEAQAQAAYARNPIPELPVSQFKVRGGYQYASSGSRGLWDLDPHNIMPRFGLAYQLNDKTVIRSGFGLFFDSLGIGRNALPNQPGFSRSTELVSSVDNGLHYLSSLSNPFPNGLLRPVGSSLGVNLDAGNGIFVGYRGVRNPYTMHWSFGLQRELPGRFVLDVSYVGSKSVALPQVPSGVDLNTLPRKYLSTLPTRDEENLTFLNQPVANPFAGLLPGTDLEGDVIPHAGLLIPYPQYPGGVYAITTAGMGWYHALQARIERRMRGGFTMVGNYTWSKNMSAINYLNPTDPAPEHVTDSLDPGQTFTIAGVYELPVGRGRRWGNGWRSAVNQFLGGWQFGSVFKAQRGLAVYVSDAILLPGKSMYDAVLPKDQRTWDGGWFNHSAFNTNFDEQPAGNHIRTLSTRFPYLRGPGYYVLDTNLSKKFTISERVVLQFRAEAYNLTNHVNFGIYASLDPVDPESDQIPYLNGSPRVIQFGLRLSF